MIHVKALLIPSKGAEYDLGTRPIPVPGSRQVLVKNLAVALNPVDNYIQQRYIFAERLDYPAVTGADGAGEIVELGDGVTGWSTGDKVLYQSFWSSDRATFQEYTVADALSIARIPPNLTFDQAATVPSGIATAAIGFYHKKSARGGAELVAPWEVGGRGKYVGQPALVIGGSSSVGQFALQFAKLSGFDPIITTASKRNEVYCKAAGVTHLIDYKEVPYANLAAAITDIVGSSGVPLVYDAISIPESQQAGWAALAPKGSIVVTLQPVVGKPGEEAENGKRTVWVYGMGNEDENLDFFVRLISVLPGLLESGDIKPNNIEVLEGGLAGIKDGLVRLAQGASAVKFVARPQETP